MSDEDMTCFFCGRGGVRAAVIDEVTDPGCDIANVPVYATSCPYCGACGPMALSEDEAVDAWNRRAGRTCRVVHNENGYPSCSECGAHYLCMLDASYCPDCGARMVVE